MTLKFSRSELAKKGLEPFSFDEEIQFPEETFQSLSGLRGLKDVRVQGSAQFFANEEHLLVNFTVEGVMILPCALTNVDVDYPFSEEREVLFSFVKEKDEDDEIIEAKKGIADLMPVIFETIICEVPLKVVSPNATILRKGDGWELISEEDLANQEEEFDPRLAKLRELLKNDD